MKLFLRILFAIPGILLFFVGYTAGFVTFFVVPGYRAALATFSALGDDEEDEI